MSHLHCQAKMTEVLKADDELVRCPLPRWQRKAQEQGLSTLSLPQENSNSNKHFTSVLSASPNSARTPHSGSFMELNTSKKGKSPGRVIPRLTVRAAGQKTPGGKTPTTPHNCSDRFIPNRSTTDIDRSHLLLMNTMNGTDDNNDSDLSQQQKEYKEKMSENLNNGVPLDTRILSFSSKVPEAREGHLNNQQVLYSASKAAPKVAATRFIPSVPEKVLDAPELLDDYYLHLIDWSINNQLAAALGSSVYIWNAGDGSITPLVEYDSPDYVCSLSWIKEGNVLAVGLSNMTIQLWDIGQSKIIRTMGGHDGRIATLSWNSYTLSAGTRSGQIVHNDVRVAEHNVATLTNHTQEVCGLKWSNDGRYLASGGNDNIVNIWEKGATTPLHTFSQHQAAVKALAWCPFQQDILASGGGTADRSIKIWNCTRGTCLKDVTTNSQVSALVWSTNYKEIISGHGFSHNQLTIWKYPSFSKVIELTGHSGRVLELCGSPDGQTVVSAAADETLRLWKCWAVDKKEKKQQKTNKSHPVSMLARSIR